MNKKIIIVILVLLCFLTSFSVEAQWERKSEPLPEIKIAPEPIAKIEKAMGWTYNYKGQWISKENTLPGYEVKNTKGFHYFLGILDSFATLYLTQIKINNTEYILFIKSNKYSIECYIITKNTYESITYKNEIKNEPKLFEIEYIYKDFIKFSKINYTDISQKIEEELKGYILKKKRNNEEIFNNNNNEAFYINLLPLKDKDIIRFVIIPETKSFIFETRFYSNASLFPGGFQSFLKPQTFKQCYYELDYEVFTKMFPLE